MGAISHSGDTMISKAPPAALLLLLLLPAFSLAQPVDQPAGQANTSSRMLKWEFKTSDFIDSSPEFGEGLVFIGSADKNMYAFDAITGHEKWRFATEGFVESSPTYYNGMVYFGSNDNSTYALNASSGELAWRYNTSGKVYSSPCVASGYVFFGSADGSLYAVDAISGAFRWNYTTGAAVYSSPTVGSNIVYVGSNDAKLHAINASTGQQVWEYETGGPIYSSPRVFNNVAYFGSYDGRFYALDAFNGTKVWSFSTNDKILSSPAVDRGVAWTGSTDGNLYALNAFTGALLWSFNANESIESSPFFSARNNAVYFGANDNRLYALNALSGALLWSYRTENWVTSTPVLSGSLIYFGSYDKRIYAVSTMTSFITYPESGQGVNGSVLTIRGVSVADGGVKAVELQIGADPAWRVATGTGQWSYSWGIANIPQGGYRIRVRTTDNSNEVEVEPLRQISVNIRQRNNTFDKPMTVEFPARLRYGGYIRIAVTDADGNQVPFVRVMMMNQTYYDSDGNGIVDTDQAGEPIAVNQESGEITFTVLKDGYFVPSSQRLAIEIYKEDQTSLYLGAGALLVVVAVAAYIWKKRREPGYA